MEKNAPSNRYRFPKSRSKNFKKALGLAQALQGFEELDGFYWVEPTVEEISGKKFQKLVSYSKNWKDAGFFVGDTEIDEADWPKSAEEPVEVQDVQTGDTQPPAPTKGSEEVSVAEKPAEDSSSGVAESTEAIAARPESSDKPPTAEAEPAAEQKAVSKPETKMENKAAETSAPEPKETNASASKETPQGVKAESKKASKVSGGPAKVEINAPPEEPIPPMAVAAMWVLIVIVLFLFWKITFGSS